MRQTYLKNYVEDRKLRASLELLNWFILFKTANPESIPFAGIFLRLADRTLHHSSNVWSQFISDLKVPTDVLKQFPDDAVVWTQDLSSKYEIEAYLGAAKALFEKNLIGVNEPKQRNFLGRSFVAHPQVLQKLKGLFAAKKNEFFQEANRIRNHSYHVNSALKDHGIVALLKKVNNGYAVTLPNIYEDEQGASVDLAEIFISTHQSIESMIREVRDIFLEFFFQQGGCPSHGSYQGIQSQYGTMTVGLGPKGFEFSDFHETNETPRSLRSIVT
jgi:hypothetical protein